MDNTFIIDNLLRQNESDVLEFKTMLSIDNIAINVTSMLNNRGGDILVGVNESKHIVGIEKDINVNNILNNLMSEISPAAPVDVQEVPYDGKKILLIRVWEGSQKPYSYKGTYYEREGNQYNSITRIVTDRKQADSNWERIPLPGADFTDLDIEEVKKTIEMYQELGARRSSDEEEFLINNGLIQNGNITNACALLYAKNPSRYFTQSQSGIRLSVFFSESISDLKEVRNYTDNIFRNIEAIFNFFDSYYSKSIEINTPQRLEKWNYPRVAVREGVMNAIVHRDYSNYQGFLHVQIFPNHLDIINYGAMEPIISYVNTGIVGYSVLRNPDIAYQCYYRKLIEMRGTGIMRMNDECKKNNFGKPIVNIDGDTVKVTFLIRDGHSAKKVEKNNVDTVPNNSITEKILTAISEYPNITKKELATICGITEDGVDGIIWKLKQMGKISRVGPNEDGYWKVV